MGDNESGNDAVDRALRLFVYGPVGIACYLKDSAPTFMDLFVSRGKREVDSLRRTVEERLGVATEPAPPPSAQQRMADSIGSLSKVAAQAGSMAAAMAGPVVKAGAGAAASAARTVGGTNGATNGTAGAPEASTSAPAGPSASPEARPTPGGIPSVGNPETAMPGAASVPHGGDLPIPGYDGLSASQVIERLEGLSRGALERVRGYELAHRARRTILASIDQLTS